MKYRLSSFFTRLSLVLSFILFVSTSAMALADQPSANTDLVAGISHLQHEWARIKYQVADKKDQISEIHRLAEEAEDIAKSYPQQAEAKIWQGIIISTEAGIDRGMSSLGKLKDAKALFLSAIKLDPNALMGSAYTSLASLYYQAPSWPISFGSNKKAQQYFTKALVINPDGIDSNFFYADFLQTKEKYTEAKTYLERALAAKPRPDRPLADEGRRQEIRAMLAAINDKLKYQHTDSHH